MAAKKITTFQIAHQSNIEQYKKMLETHLTEQERMFVKRCLDEERAALRALNRSPANIGMPIHKELRLDQISQLLSAIEFSILECIMQGDSNKVAAYKLQLAETTVGMHVKSILRKLRAVNQKQTTLGTTTQIRSNNDPAQSR